MSCVNINLPGCACLTLRKTATFLLSVLDVSCLDLADGFFSIQLWAKSKKYFLFSCVFINTRGRRCVSFFLLEQLLRRLGRRKVVLSILSTLCPFDRKMLQMLRVVPPKIAFCCGNFSPGVVRPLASQDQAMYMSLWSYLDYFEENDTSI